MVSLLAIPLLLSVSCAKTDTGTKETGEAIAFRVTSGSTRADLVDNDNLVAKYGTDGMGVFAAAYEGNWDGTQTVDYFANAQFAPSGDFWVSPNASYYWPGKGKNIRFFAYAPFNGEGITLPAADITGVPTLDYVNPENLSEQKELLVASTEEMDGCPKVIVKDIQLKHALTAIRFKCSPDMINGTIDKITIEGLKGAGTVTMESEPKWTVSGEACNYSATMSFTHQKGEETIMYGENNEYTFLVIPQDVTDAKIKVSFTPENGYKNELTKPLDFELVPGTINNVILTITKSMITFTVTVESLTEGKTIDLS